MPTVPQQSAFQKWYDTNVPPSKATGPDRDSPEGSEFAHWYRRAVYQDTVRANLSRTEGEQIAPDLAAKVSNLSAIFGLSPDIIAEDPQTYEREAANRNGRDLLDYGLKSEGVRRFLGKSKYYSALLKNQVDLKNVVDVEQLVTRPPELWARPESFVKEDAKAYAEATWPEELASMRRHQQLNPVHGLIMSIKPEAESKKEHGARILADFLQFEKFASQDSEVGAIEQLVQTFRENPLAILPFAGDVLPAKRALRLLEAIGRTRDGNPNAEDEHILERIGRHEALLAHRGVSIGADIVSSAVDLVKNSTEFGLTAGAYTAGKQVVLQGVKSLGKKALEAELKSAIKITLAKRIGSYAAGHGLQTLVRSPISASVRYLQSITPDVHLTADQNNDLQIALGDDDKDRFFAAYEAFSGALISNVAEKSGYVVERFITAPVKTALISRYMRRNPGVGLEAVLAKIKTKTGWNGIFAESFEERVEAGARAAAGIGEFSDIIPTWRELAVEGATLSIPGLGAYGLRRGLEVTSVRKPELVEDAMSKIAEALRDNPAAKHAPEEIAKVLNESSGGKKISVSVAAWDEIWEKKKDETGNSADPRQKAAEIIGDDGTAYDQAKAQEIDLQVPIGEASVKLLADEDLGRLWQANLRLDPDEKSAADVREEFEALEKERVSEEKKEKASQPSEKAIEEATASVGAVVLTDRAKKIAVESNIPIEQATDQAAREVVTEQIEVRETTQRTERDVNRNKLRDAISKSLFGINLKGAKRSTVDIFAEKLLITAERNKISPDALISVLPKVKEVEDAREGLAQESSSTPEDSGEAAPSGQPANNRATVVKRGFFSRTQNLIGLLPEMNRSTFLHEFEHWYVNLIEALETSGQLAPEFRADMEALWEAAGAKLGTKLTDAQHETLAKLWEDYVMRGEAPSERLRNAFYRMRTFLTDIYRMFKSYFDGIELKPEARDLFDRLLATQEELAVVEANRSMQPLYEIARRANVSSEDAAALEVAAASAKSQADAQFLEKRMADIRKRESIAWKQEASDLRLEIEPAVAAMPQYQALEVLTRKEEPDQPSMKLSREGIEEAFGDRAEAILASMPPGTVVSRSDGGLDPSQVAEPLGYESGEKLVLDLASTIPMKDYVDKVVNETMEERYGLPMSEEEIEHEAMGALHNQDRSAMLKLEMKILMAQYAGTTKRAIAAPMVKLPSLEVMRREARRSIGDKAIGDLDIRVYAAAERRAAQKKANAYRKDDIATYLKEAYAEWMAHERYRAAREAKDGAKKQLAKWKDFLGRSEDSLSANRDMSLVAAAKSILGMFKIGTARQIGRAQEQIKHIEDYAPDVYKSMKEDIEAAQRNAKDFNLLTVDEFDDLKGVVDSFLRLSVSLRKFTKENEKVAIEEIRNKILDVLNKRSKPSALKKYNSTKSGWDKAGTAFMHIGASFRRIESWADAFDGGKIDGPAHEFIYLPIKEGADQYRDQRVVYHNKVQKIIEALVNKMPREEIFSDDLGYRFKGLGQVLMAIMHSGSNSSLDKLLRGMGWGSQIKNEDGTRTLDRSKWDAFLADMFKRKIVTKEHMDVLQAIGNLFEELKPGAQKAYIEIYGKPFYEIDAAPIETEFGTYAGWYFPAIPDPDESTAAALREHRKVLQGSDYQGSIAPTGGRGFTRERDKDFVAPLLLDFSLVQRHIDEVLRFTYIEPRVQELNRLVLGDKSFYNLLEALDPGLVDSLIVPFAWRAASQRYDKPSGSGQVFHYLDAAGRWVRNTGARSVMFGNVVNALVQETGHAVALSRVSARHLAAAHKSFFDNPSDIKKIVDLILEKSSTMRNFSHTTLIEAADTMGKFMVDPSPYEKGTRWIAENAYILQNITQGHVNFVVWWGAYNEAIENGLNEKKAVRSADSAVRLTQGSIAPEDIARVESGNPWWRVLMTFSGYANTIANLQVTESKKAIQEMGLKDGAGRLVYVFMVTAAIPVAMSVAIRAAIAGGPEDDDGDGYLDEYAYRFSGELWQSLAAELSPPGSALARKFVTYGQQYESRILDSPGIQLVENSLGGIDTVRKLIASMFMEQNLTKQDIKEVISLAAILSKIPAGQAVKAGGFVYDVNTGRQNPQDAVEYVRGLLTGKVAQ